MTLQQLAYFVAVADVRSFTRAAERVGVAQPTLSRQLKALEDELGASLVNRDKAVTLTPAGEVVLPFARRMLADSDSARAAVAEIVGYLIALVVVLPIGAALAYGERSRYGSVVLAIAGVTYAVLVLRTYQVWAVTGV